MPPPATVGESCVYVVRRADGWLYCGETDNIKRTGMPLFFKQSQKTEGGSDIS